MPPYRLYQVDAFTAQKFKGNPAGVISNADGLSQSQMQALARELNNSETAFVLSPEGPDHEVRLRFFTPIVEVPICGHATIAAHYVRAVERKEISRRVWHKTGVGVLPVDLIREGDDYRIVVTQAPPEFGARLEGEERECLLTALSLAERDVVKGVPLQIVSTGHSKVMVPIESRRTLLGLTPDAPSLVQLSRRIGCNGYFVFTIDSDEPAILTRGRMFAPAIGVLEDPVTGNASGPLGAYLVRYRLVNVDGGEFRFKAHQGEALGRPGTVDVTVRIDGGRPSGVMIGGTAVIVFAAQLDM